jgi:hypothetical protein
VCHVGIEVLFVHRKAETMRQFAERAVTVHHMVSYGDDIEPCLTEEINGSPQLYRTVGVRCVNVKITQ